MAEAPRSPLLELGYWLSGEEHDPKTFVGNAARAEEAGFGVAGISDHFHPFEQSRSSRGHLGYGLSGTA